MRYLFDFCKQILKLLVIAGIFYAILRYIGEFSESQSAVLAFFLWAIYDFARESRKKQEEFEPYTLWIEPKWRDLLRDYKLLKDDQWESVKSKLALLPESEYNVLRAGFHFTFLKLEPFDGLIYRNDRRYFRGELDFRERIEEIEIPLPDTHFEFSPTIFVKWGREGYDIGITTPKSFRQSYHPLDDNDLVVVATLPYETFRLFENRRSTWSFVKVAQKAREEALVNRGWKVNESDPDLPNWGETFEHKYFYVSLRGI